MKIVAINGSHRKGKNTAMLLGAVLDEVSNMGISTELVELADLNIKNCSSCNKCLRNPLCSIRNDDMSALGDKLLSADGILLGSPVYWSNVSTLMKNFMDRSRYLHMTRNFLAGKVGAALTNAGLRHGGQETTLRIMEYFLQAHGLQIADCRDPGGTIISAGVAGTLMAGFKDNQVQWLPNVLEDQLVLESCKQLGRNMVRLILKLQK